VGTNVTLLNIGPMTDGLISAKPDELFDISPVAFQGMRRDSPLDFKLSEKISQYFSGSLIHMN
jgi:hypothetical protein